VKQDVGQHQGIFKRENARGMSLYSGDYHKNTVEHSVISKKTGLGDMAATLQAYS
jgi:hypothetical protein